MNFVPVAQLPVGSALPMELRHFTIKEVDKRVYGNPLEVLLPGRPIVGAMCESNVRINVVPVRKFTELEVGDNALNWKLDPIVSFSSLIVMFVIPNK